ncbi:MAG: hypothetical protein A4E64_03015 [Syntrophorhabdus sp. PtaU1.Bin058]|nr:MAG: hypothetical protein A4E64_03015 [Syntrophorhabdus sp. PtaU1.Bin058]
MSVFLAILTYFAYVFIIVAYSAKIVKYVNLPTHLRWELYPVIHEEKYRYGGSYFENPDWWEKIRTKSRIRGISYLLKEYFILSDYLKHNASYWLALYPWHMGFILIITFHILCFFGALAMVLGITISAGSPDISGRIFYYAILLTGVISFIAGAVGSIGLFIKRLADEKLRIYASLLSFFGYILTLAVFLSGLYSWYFIDPSLAEYREFWVGLITLHFIGIKPATAVHIVLFDFFLIYLPFTRSLHYITRFLVFFLVRWDDEPNVRGSELEKRLTKLFDQKITWSAPHIQTGKKWSEQ